MNDKKLLALEVEFSNIHLARIPFEYIGVLQLNGLKKIEYTLKNPRNSNSNDPEYTVKQFVISIDRNCLGAIYCLLTGEHINDDAMDWLRTCQIVQIDCIYEDGSEKDTVQPVRYDEVLYIQEDGSKVYNGDFMNHNEYQRSKVNKQGDLFIEISEKAELDSIFPDEIINADDYIVREMNNEVDRL